MDWSALRNIAQVLTVTVLISPWNIPQHNRWQLWVLFDNMLIYPLIQGHWFWRLGLTLVESLISEYFHAGFKYEETTTLLKRPHGIEVSLTLYWLLRQQNLYNKGMQSPVPDIVSFIQLSFIETSFTLDTVQWSKYVSKINFIYRRSCCTNNERPGPCWCWCFIKSEEHWEVAHALLRFQTGYGIYDKLKRRMCSWMQ